MSDPEQESPTIVAAVKYLSERCEADLAAACARAGATYVRWSGDKMTPELTETPSLLIAGLPNSERRLPDEVSQFVTKKHPGVRLLLLCEEPLIRPLLTLEDGQIMLAGPPHTPARIYSRLLIATPKPHGRRDTMPWPLKDERLIASSVQSSSNWWVAAVRCHAGDPGVEQALPLIQHGDGEGLTAIVPLSDASRPGESTLARVLEILKTEERDEQKDRAFGMLLGNNAGVVHLTRGASDWIFYWPETSRPLWMSSLSRLPAWWNLADSFAKGGVRVWRMPASNGDVILAASAALGAAQAAEGDEALRSAMADGAPALLHSFRAFMEAHPAPVSAFIAEVI